MKMTLRILLLTLLALATTMILSCGPPPVSIDDRISMFVTSLNGNNTDTYTHTDPNAAQYAAARTALFWSALFPTPPYTQSGLNSSNPAAVTVTISPGGVYTFAMVNNKITGSDNWLISKITNPGSTVIFQ